jgi:DNA-binding response OmpR family regulator
MPKPTILVIDDEKDILKLVQYNLEKEGYQVLLARTGEEGFEAAKAKSPALVLLDLMLPGMDGLEVCKLLRADKATKKIPILMLTAKGSETDQIVGLELGATDYVAKPFSVKVLLARVKTILRARDTGLEEAAVLKAGDFTLDRDRQSFTVKGKPVAFTKLEFNILAFLMQNPGKVFSREKLLSGAWEGEAFVVDRTVDVHVRSIRRKLGKHRDAIETVHGTGYRFSENAVAG